MFSGFHGDTFNCPAEVAEARYGLYVEQLALNDEPGGEGEHRGGKGIVLDYLVRADGCFFTCAYTRNKQLPWPLDGGREGSPNYVEVIRADGSVEEHAVVTALTVNEGDLIRLHTAQRGRLRRPAPRPRELVLATCATATSRTRGAHRLRPRRRTRDDTFTLGDVSVAPGEVGRGTLMKFSWPARRS